MVTNTAHFSIGDGYGELITQIAREKLIEDKAPKKAIKILTDTCPGMEEKMALEIILGYKTLKTDELSQQLVVDPDEKGEIEPRYIGYNYKTLELKLQEFSMDARKFKYHLENEVVKARRKSVYLSADVLIPYFNEGNTEEIEDEVNDTYIELREYYTFATGFLKRFTVFFNWLIESKKVSDELGVVITEELSKATLPIPEHIATLHAYLQELEAGHIIDVEPVGNSDLDKYVKGFKNLEALDEAVKSKEGLKPVDLKTKYDAGFIAPNGDYYAVNGEIANMLHLNLADSMVKAGIIPKDFDREVNADVWLERNGWVKQHGDHILYGGYDNSKLGRTDVPITKEQLKTIKLIIRLHYRGIIWPGFDPANRCSVLSWAASDPLQFKLKWFAL